MAQPLTDTQLKGGHGGQGSQEASFCRLLRKDVDYAPLVLSNPDEALKLVALAMKQDVDPNLKDLPDDQENPYVPAGYTYFGQLVDHDLTFDTRSTLDTITPGLSSFPDNERTPRLDLDCLYGEGPHSSAFMYDGDGRLLTNPDKPYDLPRARNPFTPGDPNSHRAIIGDPRNDENSIVCQLQLAFIKFHNAAIDHFKDSVAPGALFATAQREVRYTYQKIIVTDFLKRIVQEKVYDDFVQAYETQGSAAFKLYKPGPLRNALPIEFAGAAYRFGHSQIRNTYRLNAQYKTFVFDGSDDSALSLVGFGDLPESHKIDWSLFVTDTLAPGTKGDNPAQKPDGSDVPEDAKRLQFAYKIDTGLVDPLAHLPPRIGGVDKNATFASLMARNLKRGYNFSLPSGQDMARALGVTTHPPLLLGDSLTAFKDVKGLSASDVAALTAHTPLWIYILAEAQVGLVGADGKKIVDSNKGTQLGPVGGRILLEVFFGLLDSDDGSYFQDKTWDPIVKPGADTLTLWDLLHFGGSI